MSVAERGPFFVVDSEGRPLMPIDEKQALNRLKRPYQLLEEHHAFTILKLEHEVVKPQLGAVALTVLPHREVADLYIVAEYGRAGHPFLRVVLDTSMMPLQNLHEYQTARPWPRPAAYAAAVGDVVGALQRFLPISHGILPLDLLLKNDVSTTYDLWQQEVLILLIDQLAAKGLDFCANPPRGQSRRIRDRALGRAMWRFLVGRQPSKCVIARHNVWNYSSLTLHQCMPTDTSEQAQHGLLRFHRGEILCQVNHANRNVLGILDYEGMDGFLRILVPQVVYPLRVEWLHLKSKEVRLVPTLEDGHVRFYWPLERLRK